MSNLLEKAFNNEELGIELNSYIDKKLMVWFKAKEVAQILGYKNTEKAIKRHVSENHKRKILFSNQHETHGCSMTYFWMKQVFTNLFLDLDYILQKCFANGSLLKFFLQFANMDTIE